MTSLAIPAVCAGESFSTPGISTGWSLPTSSTCGARPGEKIKSLTLSETASMRCNTVARLRAGCDVASTFGVVKVALIYVLRSFKWLFNSFKVTSKRLNDKKCHVISSAFPISPFQQITMKKVDHFARADFSITTDRID